jgi:transposase
MNMKAKMDHLKRDGTLHPQPDKVSADLLGRSDFFDATDLVQMKYEMLRSVDVDKMSITEAARLFGLSRVAYYRARQQYGRSGLAGLLPAKRGPKGPHKLTDEVLAFVRCQIEDMSTAPDWKSLSRQVVEKFGVKANPRSIARAVGGREQ